ncbi:MAG: Gfo/Idh/MocA family oxidoreductase [Candidatus Hydrogenedentes bacterium]|nr:Gfo/Idh/MocA family oxidoreductase [Candidatus Hydrogenedentota bacterium]
MSTKTLSRRQFIAAGAAGLAVAAAPSHAKSSVPPRAGLIGCGGGGHALADILARPGAPMRIARLCDLDPHRASAIADQTGAALESGWEPMIESPDLDAILIATPDDSHAEIARRALEAGKHVYVLPPLALDAQSIQGLREAADRSDRVICVAMDPAQERRWRDAAAQLTAEKKTPYRIHVALKPGPDEPAGHWARCAARSLGPAARELFNNVYPMMRHLLPDGTPRASALGGAFGRDPRETPDAVALTLDYPSLSAVAVYMPGRGYEPDIIRGRAGNIMLPPLTPAPAWDIDSFAHAVATGDASAMRARFEIACKAQTAICKALGPMFKPVV